MKNRPSRCILAVAIAMLALSPLLQVVPAVLPEGNVDAAKVCTVASDGATLKDVTAEAKNDFPGDVPLGMGTVSGGPRWLYIGGTEKFSGAAFKMDAAGVGGEVYWTYWSGSSWKPLNVIDATASFTAAGRPLLSLTIPADWVPFSFDSSSCPGSRYFVRAETIVTYTSAPAAGQMALIQYNVRVKVQDQLGEPVLGLVRSNFIVTGNSLASVFAFREIGQGTYEMALNTAGNNPAYTIKANQEGYLTSQPLSTANAGATLLDVTDKPLVLTFGVQVLLGTEESPEDADAVWAGNTPCRATTRVGHWMCPFPVRHDGRDVTVRWTDSTTTRFLDAFSDRDSASSPVVTAPSRVATIASELPDGRLSMGAVSFQDHIYLVGGTGGNYPRGATKEILRFDPADETVTVIAAELPIPLQGVAASTDGDAIFLFGGTDGTYWSDRIYSWDPTTTIVEARQAKLPAGLSDIGVAFDGSDFYLFGGWTGKMWPNTYTKEIYRYDPVEDILTVMPAAFAEGYGYMSAAWDGEKIVLMGPYFTNRIWHFEPSTGSLMQSSTSLPSTRYWGSLVATADGVTHFLGGTGNPTVSDIVRYDSDTLTLVNMDQAVPGDHLPRPLYAHAAAYSDGKIWVFGGSSTDGAYRSDALRYDLGLWLKKGTGQVGAPPPPPPPPPPEDNSTDLPGSDLTRDLPQDTPAPPPQTQSRTVPRAPRAPGSSSNSSNDYEDYEWPEEEAYVEPEGDEANETFDGNESASSARPTRDPLRGGGFNPNITRPPDSTTPGLDLVAAAIAIAFVAMWIGRRNRR